MRRWVAGFLLLLLLALGVPWSQATAQDWYASSYELGRSYYLEGRYMAAIQHFRELLEISRTHELSDNCQYWIAVCYFNRGDNEQAIIEFDRTLTFPNNNKREDALYMMAECHHRLGEDRQARELYLRLLADYPNSRHASDALGKVKSLGPGS